MPATRRSSTRGCVTATGPTPATSLRVGVMAVADHLLATAPVVDAGVPLNPVGDLRLNRLPQQTLRPVA